MYNIVLIWYSTWAITCKMEDITYLNDFSFWLSMLWINFAPGAFRWTWCCLCFLPSRYGGNSATYKIRCHNKKTGHHCQGPGIYRTPTSVMSHIPSFSQPSVFLFFVYSNLYYYMPYHCFSFILLADLVWGKRIGSCSYCPFSKRC